MPLNQDNLKQIWTALTLADQLSTNKALNADLKPAMAAVLAELTAKAEEAEFERTAPPPPTLESFADIKPLGFRHSLAEGSFSSESWVFDAAIALYSAQQLLAAGWQVGRNTPVSAASSGLLTPLEVWQAAGGKSGVTPTREEVLAALRQRTKPRVVAPVPAPAVALGAESKSPRTPGEPPKTVPTLTVQTAEVTDEMVELFNSEIEVQRSGAIHGLDMGLRAMLRASTVPSVQALASRHFVESWIIAFHEQVQVQRTGNIVGLKQGLLAFIHAGLNGRAPDLEEKPKSIRTWWGSERPIPATA